MKSCRSQLATSLLYILVSLAAIRFHAPFWLTLYLVVAASLLTEGLKHWRSAARPIAEDPEPDRADLVRLWAALAVAGEPDLYATPVAPAEGACFRLHRGRLHFSRNLLHLLTDAELVAMVQTEVGPAAREVRLVRRRHEWPWLGCLTLPLLAIPWYPAAWVLVPAVLVVFGLISQSRFVRTRLARQEAAALRRRGVDLTSLVTAQAKYVGELLRTSPSAPTRAEQLRQGIVRLAPEAGVTLDDLEDRFAISLRGSWLP